MAMTNINMAWMVNKFNHLCTVKSFAASPVAVYSIA